jgi:hypothetical protein
MTSDHNKKLLNSEEQEFVERLTVHYTPTPLTSAQRLASDRALNARLARRARISFFHPFPVIATAVAVFFLWFSAPYRSAHKPTVGTPTPSENVASLDATQLDDDDNLLTYAYYNSEFDEDENEGEDTSFLPDEYEALDSAFMFPGA